MAGAVLVAGISLVAPAAADHGRGYTDFQRDVTALHQGGVIGVQGRIVTEWGRQVTATSGVADRETGSAVSDRSHFRIASNTKMFVATVVLQLVGEGRLGLEDPVERHLPGVIRGNGNDGSRITVRQLLQHTSGLYDYQSQWLPTPEVFEANRFRHFDPAELVAMALRHPPTNEVGMFRYSNTNYVVAGMIVKSVTGASWAAEVERRLIRPVGLAHTSIPGDDPTMPLPTARGYQQWFPSQLVTDTTEQNRTASDAAGAMISTTADLTRFVRALLSGRLLRPAQLAEMKRVVPVNEGGRVGYGLGLVQFRLSCGDQFWGLGGQNTGYISPVAATADGRRSIVMSLTGPTGKTLADVAKMQALTEQIRDKALCTR